MKKLLERPEKWTNYTAFGMEMPGRSVGNDYEFGFNGKTNDNEMYEGAQDFGARMYDNRLGRFFTVDPKSGKYPNYSPYLFGGNRPIDAIDYEGEGPRYPAIAAAFEARLNKLRDASTKDNRLSYIKYENVENKIVYSVNLTMNGHTINQVFEFNEEVDDQDYNTLLINWGVDFYDAACASSNSLADRAYWRLRQNENHYKKPENGIPLLFKTWATVLSMGAAAEGFAAMSFADKVLLTVDGVLLLDDCTSIFNGPDYTFLQYLAEKAGIDPKRVEQAKTANDVFQGLRDIKKIIDEVRSTVQTLNSAGSATERTTKTTIEWLDFIQGQIDMQKQYWELMKKGIETPNTDSKKTEEKKSHQTRSQF